MMDFDRLVKETDWLKALAHPVRMKIVLSLAYNSLSSVNGIKEALDLPQSTVSQHLQLLRHAGIVKGEKDGTIVNYSISDSRVETLLKLIFPDIG